MQSKVLPSRLLHETHIRMEHVEAHIKRGNQMHRLLAVTLATITLLANPGTVRSATTPAAPQILAVKFHGDWCGSCKKMGPVFTDLQNKLDGLPVLFVTLDLTNNTTRHQSSLMASALGLGRAYVENPGTGFILLIDSKSRQVVKKLTANMTLKEMAVEIQTLIKT